MDEVNNLTAKIISLLSEMKSVEPKTFDHWVKKLSYLAEDLEGDCRQAKRWAGFKDDEKGG